MVITPKHVGAVLMPILMRILELFLRQFNCASVGKRINFDSTNMHGNYVKITRLKQSASDQCTTHTLIRT